jgi:hypothetical protein
MFTVIVQSLTAVPIARALKVTLPDSDGFLIVSSNPVSRAIARALMESDIAVMLADRSRRRRLKAEKEHIPTYRETLPEEFEAGYFDEYGLGSLLALSADEHENIEATIAYRRVFKRDNVYSIRSRRENGKNQSERRLRRASRLFGKTLFSNRIDYQMLLQMLEKGAELHFFALDQKLDPRQFHEQCGREAVMLFAFDTRNKAHCFSAEAVPSADAGWRILYLGFQPPTI